jgi:putative glycerol-1-phosphate prenyltransferase
MAGEMLGLKLIFLDAGSGAKNPVSGAMIQATSVVIDCPLIVGGGIKTAEKVAENFKAGADLLVIGNSLEENPDLITELSKARFNY